MAAGRIDHLILNSPYRPSVRGNLDRSRIVDNPPRSVFHHNIGMESRETEMPGAGLGRREKAEGAISLHSGGRRLNLCRNGWRIGQFGNAGCEQNNAK
jgi:hypothetical protein